jgi:serine/threonine-protein kinase
VIDLDRLRSALASEYELGRELARGGMATVFLATQRHPRRAVAIKVFQPEASARMGEARFRREIELASQLTHPGIVSIYAAGEAEGLLYYVMPYVEGETLRDRLEREGQLPLGDVVTYVKDIAEALEYAHRRNIVHRDIKPPNVLLHEGRAFVADFGIARALSVESLHGLTEEGHAVGTPEYMSPEQIEGGDGIDARSDQYALACVVYEMLSGEPPFKGRSVQSILTRHLSDTASPIRVLRKTVPPDVDAVVARGLAKHKADRFPAVTDFAAALIRAIDPMTTVRIATPAPVTPVSLATRSMAIGQRAWERRWVGMAAALAIVAAGGWILLKAPRSDAATVRRVAVRTVDNLTGQPAHDTTAELLTADMIDLLHAVKQLSVTDRSSSVALSGTPLTTRQFAESLDVSLVIEGELRLEQGQVVLRAHLADSSGSILTRADRDRPERELIGAATRDQGRAQLARAIVGELLLPRGLTLPDRREHEHLEARDLLLGGTRELAGRSAEGMRAAVRLFDSAIAVDRDYARAYAELSKAYGLAVNYRYRMDVEPYAAAGIALAAADRAVAEDPGVSAGYTARAYIQRLTMAPSEVVAAAYAEAKRLDPSAADAVAWSALALSAQGRTTEAVAEARKAVQLDKLSASRRITLAVVAYTMRRFDESAAAAAAASRLAPELALARVWWARALVMGGRARECADADLGPHAGMRALCLRAAGRTGEAEAIVDSLTRAYDAGGLVDSVYTDVIRLEDLATYHAYAGDARQAGLWVARAYDRAPNGVEAFVLESALFDKVRGAAEFAEMTEGARRRVVERVRQARDEAELRVRAPGGTDGRDRH